MREQRTEQRRNYAVIREFPLIDDRGCIVPFDRSRIPDRRLNNLKLAETGVEFFRRLRMTRQRAGAFIMPGVGEYNTPGE